MVKELNALKDLLSMFTSNQRFALFDIHIIDVVTLPIMRRNHPKRI
jgi:hypothetical protein|tara:strand:+ start:1568 stop:1705 length:138 start_codon:yes stop_codon:yes gene_type:complete